MLIKVAIVDDHPMLIRGLQNMLSCTSYIEVTGAYLSGSDFLKDISRNVPDILLLDIQMPECSGDELAGMLHKQYPELAILAFTNLEHPYYITSMIKNGVRGYILKSSGETALLNAIQTVYRGSYYFDPVINRQAADALKPSSYVSLKKPLLTAREKEVLALIAADFSSQDIAAKLYITKRTVDFHRANLLLKMDAKNAASLVKKAIELGLIK